MPGFSNVNRHKKVNIQLSFKNNSLDMTNLLCKLRKTGKDKIIFTAENIILNWLIFVSINNLHYYFISEAF